MCCLRIETYQLKLSELALAYAAMLRALPALQEWIKVGQLEPRHEAACLRYGILVKDFRITY